MSSFVGLIKNYIQSPIKYGFKYMDTEEKVDTYIQRVSDMLDIANKHITITEDQAAKVKCVIAKNVPSIEFEHISLTHEVTDQLVDKLTLNKEGKPVEVLYDKYMGLLDKNIKEANLDMDPDNYSETTDRLFKDLVLKLLYDYSKESAATTEELMKIVFDILKKHNEYISPLVKDIILLEYGDIYDDIQDNRNSTANLLTADFRNEMKSYFRKIELKE